MRQAPVRLILAVSLATGLLQTIYRIEAARAYGGNPRVLDNAISELTSTLASGLLFVILYPAIRRLRIQRFTWRRVLPTHAALLIAYSLAHTFLMWATRTVLFPWFGLGEYRYGSLPERIRMEMAADIGAYAAFLIGIHLLWTYRESQERLLDNLRLQLQPHFLFNTLNMISATVYESPRRADEMIARLSELLRRTLATQTDTVPLAEEIETLEMYLDVLAARFEDRLFVDVRIDDAVRGMRVPALILQPLVENALKHGFDPASERMEIEVRAERLGSRLRLQVADRGRGSADGAGDGLGLKNTAARIQQIYGAAGRFASGNAPSGGFRAEIEIPCES